MKTGRVFLVGAGPGDYKLITLKGLECIQKADVILYDRLVSEKLLQFARKDAELIYVGKAPHHHTYSQEEINRLLVEKGKEGKIVTRIKGGDPFVFGRGGEEAQALRENGISFEVVPGITSAIAVPAYAGIPVTHRNVSSSFHVITGHEDPTKEEKAIDYETLARLEGTLVFLMGIHNLRHISTNLIRYGMKESRPVAVIMRGTTSEHKMVKGTLADIHTKTEANSIKNPSIVVIGEVVNLSEILSWYEHKPLFGKRVLVTRTRQQTSYLAEKIEALGGEVIEFPTIMIQEFQNQSEIDQALNEIQKYQWIIFTSVNGVHLFFHRMKKRKMDIRLLYKAKLCAIGPVTAKALKDMGFTVEYTPKEYRAEAIVEGLKNKIQPGEYVLLPRAEMAREVLIEELKKIGAQVDNIQVYRTTVAEQSQEKLIGMLRNRYIHIITFTSSSTVRNFVQILGEKNKDLLEGIKLAAIGPITEETARQLGLSIDIVAQEYTIDGLVRGIEKYYSD